MTDFSKFTSWPESGNMNICIVGAGNLGHVLAGMLGARENTQVSILSRKASAVGFSEGLLKDGIRVKLQSAHPKVKDRFVNGIPYKVSHRAVDVIPEADFVFITVPSHARAKIMMEIAPHIDPNRKVFVGVSPGIGGFDWISRQACQRAGLKNVILWGIKDVPYMSAWTVPGKSVTNLGPKKALYLAMANCASDSREAQVTKHLIEKITNIQTVMLPSFMVITLTPGNPIMHPAIMYGMFGPYSQWDGLPIDETPLFYEEVSELSSYFLSRADAEVQDIKNKITQVTGQELEAVWPLRLNLKKVYGDLVADNRTLMLAMRTNRAYATIRTPLKKVKGGYVPNIDHRFFLEDIPFGLVVLRDVADLVGVKTPMIDELLLWAQGLMKKEYLKNGKLAGRDIGETGAPTQYGVRSITDLVPQVSPKSKL